MHLNSNLYKPVEKRELVDEVLERNKKEVPGEQNLAKNKDSDLAEVHPEFKELVQKSLKKRTKNEEVRLTEPGKELGTIDKESEDKNCI